MYGSCGLKTTEHISHYGKYKLHTRSFMPFPARSRVGPPHAASHVRRILQRTRTFPFQFSKQNVNLSVESGSFDIF